MSNRKTWTDEQQKFLVELIGDGKTVRECVKLFEGEFGFKRSLESIKTKLERLDVSYNQSARGAKWKETQERDSWVIESNDSRINCPEDALAKANVDLDVWEIEKIVINGWDVTMKLKDGNKDRPFRSQNQQIKIVLKRKVPIDIENAVENLLNRLKEKSKVVKKFKTPKSKNSRAFEICIMDPHFGMQCLRPGADNDQTKAYCAQIVLETVDEMIELAKAYGPFEQVILPLGNDFFHINNEKSTTRGGTFLPDADGFYYTFIDGEILAVEIVERLLKVAPVFIYSIPGNHDFTTSFMLGRVLNAYFHNNANVVVNADESPYKFHRFGCNLIGYEHGHNVKPIRLAALMANECPEDWAATKHGYREWHIGDQHRKGSMSPITFEEQGVSVEFLPGITVPNNWHREKSFNWQKRGTMGYIWDAKEGPISRLQVNIDRYLNKLMGR